MQPKWPIACAAVIALAVPAQAAPPATPPLDEAPQVPLGAYVVSMGPTLRKMPRTSTVTFSNIDLPGGASVDSEVEEAKPV